MLLRSRDAVRAGRRDGARALWHLPAEVTQERRGTRTADAGPGTEPRLGGDPVRHRTRLLRSRGLRERELLRRARVPGRLPAARSAAQARAHRPVESTNRRTAGDRGTAGASPRCSTGRTEESLIARSSVWARTYPDHDDRAN